MDILTGDAWVTRNNCGWFPLWLVLLYMGSNVFIWLAYESIPITLRRLQKHGYRIFDEPTTKAFCVFVAMCGRGHLLENVLVFWYPNYLLFAIWHCFTAVISVATAAKLTTLQQTILSGDDVEALHTLQSGIGDLHLHSENLGQDIAHLKEHAAKLATLIEKS